MMPVLSPAAIDAATQRAVAHGIEGASVLLFAWACWEVRRPPGRRPLALVVCAAYGGVLEAANIAVFGSYHYPDLYALRVGSVPVCIPLLWAVILHSSMAITDRWGLPRAARPFADGLLALLIDVAVDAIAIRLGLWRWTLPSEGNRVLGFDEGWFGVPPGNLMAWMWVAASYAYFHRALDALGDGPAVGGAGQAMVRKALKSRLVREPLLVVLSYAGLFDGMFLSGMARRLLGIEDQTERLWVLGGQILVFLALACAGGRRREGGGIQEFKDSMIQPAPVPRSYRIGRWAMHGSFAALLVGTGVWRDAPALLGVSAATIVLEGVVERRCRRGRGTMQGLPASMAAVEMDRRGGRIDPLK